VLLLLEIIEPPAEDVNADAVFAVMVEIDGLSDEESKAGNELQTLTPPAV
jgi:hypothetical protein